MCTVLTNLSKMKALSTVKWALTAIFIAVTVTSYSQNSQPDVFKEGSINEQMQYLEEHTRIYENYRAIREDMFRSISRNTIDSIKSAKTRISGLTNQVSALDNRIDSLQQSLVAAKNDLDKAVRSKNSIRVLGIEVGKTAYNTVMWTLLAGLLLLLTLGYLTFRHNRSVTVRTKKDLEELKTEFEEYRTKTRIEREKVAVEHFNEIKKLKGK